MKLTTLLLFAFFAAKSTSTYVQIDPRDTWEETTLDEDLPDAWYWGDVEGTNYLTKILRFQCNTPILAWLFSLH